jgi:hypothetical protein
MRKTQLAKAEGRRQKAEIRLFNLLPSAFCLEQLREEAMP